MDGTRGYFFGSDKQFDFNPLQVFGLSAMHSDMVRNGFSDISVNTQHVDSAFSLFGVQNYGSDLGNMKHLFKQNDSGLPAANCFSKLVGGFIGSKSLVGIAANREQQFWSTVFKQYNCLVGKTYKTQSKMNNTTRCADKEVISATAIDAALLLTQGFDFMNSESNSSQKQEKINVDTLQSMKISSEPCLEKQETVSHPKSAEANFKQSYADVTKALVSRRVSVGQLPAKEFHKKNMRPHRQMKNVVHHDKFGDGIMRHGRMPGINSNWRDHHSQLELISCAKQGGYRNKMKSFKHNDRIQSPHLSESNEACFRMPFAGKKDLHHSGNVRRRPLMERKGKSDLFAAINEGKYYTEQESQNKKGVRKLNRCQYGNTIENNNFTAVNDNGPYKCKNWRCRPEEKSFCKVCEINYCRSSQILTKQSDCNNLGMLDPADTKIESTDCLRVLPTTVILDSKENESLLNNSSCDTDNSGNEFGTATVPAVRKRLSSECSVESEDSFVIVFDASADDESSSDATDSSFSEDSDGEDCSVSSECSDLSEEDNEDEVDFSFVSVPQVNDLCSEIEVFEHTSTSRIKEANNRWQSEYENLPCVEKKPKKVQFAQSSDMVTVHPMVAWSFAYRAARHGHWEEFARDRARFQCHIARLEQILTPVLSEDHRNRIWQRMQLEDGDV